MKLFILLAIYSLIRIPIILSNSENLLGYNPRGVIAHEFIHGLRLPLLDYTVDPYGLGSLFMGLWTVPFFKLFGETLFAFKLAPLCWQLLSVVAWYFVWRSFFGERRAFWLSLFFIVSPPLVTQYGLTSFGYHFEIILWTALSLLIFKKIIDGAFSQGLWIFFLGWLGGFSTALVLTNLVTVAAIWIYVLLWPGMGTGKRRFFGLYTAGFFLGVAPWFLYNILYSGAGYDFFQGIFFQGDYPKLFFTSLYKIAALALPALFEFPSLGVMGPWISKTFTFLYLFSLIYAGRQILRRPLCRTSGLDLMAFGFFYQVLFVFLNACSQTNIHSHYLFPLFPFVGSTLLIGLEKFPDRRRIIFGLWIALCFWANFQLIPWRELGKTKEMPAYSEFEKDFSFWFFLELKYGKNLPLLVEKGSALLRGESAAMKEKFYAEMSQNFLSTAKAEDFPAIFAAIQKIEPEYQPILMKNLGP